jgi:hypothetical protein
MREDHKTRIRLRTAAILHSTSVVNGACMVSGHRASTGSLLSPRQRHWASAGFGWCGALLRRHLGEEF